MDWQYQKDAAARVVAELTGVKGVDNLISVNPSLDAEGVKSRSNPLCGAVRPSRIGMFWWK